MTTPTKKETLRHNIHMKALAKSDSANAYGQATVMLMGHAVTLAVEMYKKGAKAERMRIIKKLDNPVLVGHESISDKVIASQVNEMWNTFYRDPIIEVIKDSTN